MYYNEYPLCGANLDPGEPCEEILIMGDIGVNAAEKILERLREQVKEKHIKEPAACKELLIESIREQMQVGETAYDFENEQQWLKGRMNGIGGSDASAVVGMNPYKSNIDLFEEKIGRVMPKDISDKPCVIYGKNAEEYIRELFKLDYPEYTVDHHEFRILQSKDHPFMQASLDGELTDREGRKGILEIKTTNILQSMQYEKWKDRIPDNYYIQVLHYLLVTGWQFVVLRAHLNTDWGNEKRTTVKHYFIERRDVEDDLIMLQQEEEKFWRYVESGRKPPLILPEI